LQVCNPMGGEAPESSNKPSLTPCSASTLKRHAPLLWAGKVSSRQASQTLEILTNLDIYHMLAMDTRKTLNKFFYMYKFIL